MRALLSVAPIALTLALSARAQEAPAVVDPLQEARDLIEVAPNTKENLKKGIALYESWLTDKALPAKVRADGWADAARAWLRLGDLESKNAAKIDAYTKGRAAARQGLAIDPNHTEALFWDNANLATTGRTNGVMNSLFMLGDLRKGLHRILEINPRHSFARHTLGEIDHAVPGIAGGSDERAEKQYLEVLKHDPAFTPTMVNLARFYKDKGNDEAAKKWARACLATTRSSVPGEWKKFNKKDAQQLLLELE
jgi:hypothetical protein